MRKEGSERLSDLSKVMPIAAEPASKAQVAGDKAWGLAPVHHCLPQTGAAGHAAQEHFPLNFEQLLPKEVLPQIFMVLRIEEEQVKNDRQLFTS